GAVLGLPAVQLAAQSLLSLAVFVAAEHARRADAALHPILHGDPIAGREAGHARSEAGDLSRHVEPEDARQAPGRRAAGADAEVGVIDGARPHADHDLAGSGLRVGTVAEDQLL